MKLKEEIIQAIIGSLSLSEDQVKSLNESTEPNKAVSALLSERDDNIRATFREALLNDENVIQPIKDEGYKAAQGYWNEQWRKSAMSAAGLSKDDLFENGKPKDATTIFNMVVERNKGTGKANELQDQLIAARNEISALKESKESEIESLKASYAEERQREKVHNKLREYAAKTTNPEVAFAYLKSKTEEYNSTFDEDGNFIIKKKSGLDLLKPDGKSKYENSGAFLNDIIETAGLAKKEEEPPKKDVVIVKGNEFNQNGNGKELTWAQQQAAKTLEKLGGPPAVPTE